MSRRVYVVSDNVAEGVTESENARAPVAVQVSAAGENGRDEAASAPSGGAELTDLLGTGPFFEVTRRGYDRLAVDGYVESVEAERAELRAQLRTLRVRYRAAAAAAVEARRSPDERAAEILDAARAEAEARLENVAALREAAKAARDEARRDRSAAADEIARAREEARALREEAQEIRDSATEAAARRLREIQEEMEDLRQERDEALSYLRRLTGQIESALHTLTAVLPEDASELTEGPAPVAG